MIVKFAYRNLFRQKQKSIFLGSAMALGFALFLTANAFTSGLSDILFNRVIIFMTGHIGLHRSEDASLLRSIHRDQASAMAFLKTHLTGVRNIRESITVFARAVGNAQSDMVMLVGVNPDFIDTLGIASGNVSLFEEDKIIPVVLAEDKAKFLRVSVQDSIRVRFTTVSGQMQSALLTVVAIAKRQNLFADATLYVPIQHLKSIMGYKHNESGAIQVLLEDPATAVSQANALHKKLSPRVPFLPVLTTDTATPIALRIFGFSRQNLPKNNLQILGDTPLTQDSLLLSEDAANGLGLSVGDVLSVTYVDQNTETITRSWPITHLFIAKTANIPDILLSTDRFFPLYFTHLPKDISLVSAANMPEMVSREYYISPRSSDADSFRKKSKEDRIKRHGAPIMDVRTMYETASEIVKLEAALGIVTIVGIALLFMIIFIGVINTLQLTIRERTREIGTLRAIGMQARHILQLFLLETALLAIFGAIIGTVLAKGMIFGLSQIPIVTNSPLGIFLDNGHLHFLWSWQQAILFGAILVGAAVLAAYFPARYAARLSPAEALRHTKG